MHDIDQELLNNFFDALSTREDARNSTLARWKQRIAKRNFESICEFCGTDLPTDNPHRRYAVELVPASQGGPNSVENLCLACPACAKNKRGLDPLDPNFVKHLGHPLPDALLDKRNQILLEGRNHLTPLNPWKSKETFTEYFKTRFQKPRFHMYAFGNHKARFIGFRKAFGEHATLAEASSIIKWAYGGSLQEHPEFIVYSIPEENFLDCVWHLIEANGLIEKIDFRWQESDWRYVDGNDWRRCWGETMPNLSHNMRRYNRGGPRQPWPPKVLSTNPVTVRSRKLQAKKSGQAMVIKEEQLVGTKALDLLNFWDNHPDNPGAILYDKATLRRLREEAYYLTLDPKERRSWRQRFPEFRAPKVNLDDERWSLFPSPF